MSNHLGDRDRGRDLKVGVPHRLSSLLGHGLWLDDVVVGGLDVWLRSGGLYLKFRGLVGAHEALGLGLDLLLGLGGLKESLKVVGAASLGGSSFGFLGHEFLDNLLALLAVCDSSVRVVKQSSELVLLLKLSVVSLHGDVESNYGAEGGNESNKSTSALKILLELSLRSALRSEHAEGASALLSSLSLTSFLILVGLLSNSSHSDVVVSTHSISRENLSLRLLVESSNVKKDVVGSSLVVRRFLVIPRARVVSLSRCLELGGAFGSLGDGLDGVGGVHSAHKLEDASSRNKGANDSDSLDEGANA